MCIRGLHIKFGPMWQWFLSFWWPCTPKTLYCATVCPADCPQHHEEFATRIHVFVFFFFNSCSPLKQHCAPTLYLIIYLLGTMLCDSTQRESHNGFLQPNGTLRRGKSNLLKLCRWDWSLKAVEIAKVSLPAHGATTKCSTSNTELVQ